MAGRGYVILSNEGFGGDASAALRPAAVLSAGPFFVFWGNGLEGTRPC